jgi:hypothetical protein
MLGASAYNFEDVHKNPETGENMVNRVVGVSLTYSDALFSSAGTNFKGMLTQKVSIKTADPNTVYQ